MADWIMANKAWLFSGILVAVPLAIIGLLIRSRSVVQKQKSGNNSINIQGAGDVNVQLTASEEEPKDGR